MWFQKELLGKVYSLVIYFMRLGLKKMKICHKILFRRSEECVYENFSV